MGWVHQVREGSLCVLGGGGLYFSIKSLIMKRSVSLGGWGGGGGGGGGVVLLLQVHGGP